MATQSRSRGRGRCWTPTRSLIPGFAVRDGGEPQLRSGLRRTTEAGEGMTEKQFENAEGDAENRQQDRLGLTKADHDQQMGEEKVTLIVSSLPHDCSMEKVQKYFEQQGRSVSVHSKTMLGSRRAQLELYGFTAQEKIQLQAKKHMIGGHSISVELQAPYLHPHEPLPPSDQPDSETEMECDVLEVSGLPPKADRDTLEMYFEGPRSGGCEGAMENCTFISPGVAQVKFTSPKVAARVLSKTGHKILRSPVTLQYASPSKDDHDASAKPESKLIIHELPKGVDLPVLEMLLERYMEMAANEDFTLEEEGTSVVVVFTDHKSPAELADLIANIGKGKWKGLHIQAEPYKAPSCICLKYIDTKRYDEDLISMYFESPRSKGGKVKQVQLLGNGEAVVTFEDATVIDNVLGIIHTTLGANVTVERSFGGTTPKTSRELTQPSPAAATFPGLVCSPTSSPNILAHPFEILVDPSIAIFLAKAPQKLQECAQTLHVQIEVDTKKNAIRVSPIVHFTQPGWQQQCNEAITKFIDSNCIKVEINIPQQATGEVLQLLVHTSQQETSFNFKISPDNTIATAVGEPDIIKTLQAKVEDVCSSHIQTEEQVSLTAEEYEFVSQVMQGEITAAHPGVSIQLSSADSSLLLKGSARDVRKLTQALPVYTRHVSIPLQLHPVLVQFLATEDGRKELNKLLKKQQCPIAVYFEQVSPSEQQLYFICSVTHTEQSVKAVINSVQISTEAKTCQFPQTFVSILPELHEYHQLCEELQKQHHVLIVTSNREVVVAGFSTGVINSSKVLHEFITEKSTPPKPLQIPLQPVIAKSLEKCLEELQSRIHDLHVQVTVDAQQGVIQATPIGYAKPGWQQKCQQAITSFVKNYTKVEIQIPKEATAEIMPVLLQAGQQEQSVVVEYNKKCTAATAAGHITAIKALQSKIEAIHATFMKTKEPISLKSKDYAFLSQLKKQKLVDAFPDVQIQFSHSDCTIHLEGSVRNVNKVKKALTEYCSHDSVPVQLHPLIVEFLSVEDGRQQLSKFIKSQQCPVAVHFEQATKHSHILQFICDPDLTEAAKAVANSLQAATLAKTHLLSESFISMLPELKDFDKLCRNLEKQNCIRVVTSTTDQQLTVVGFTEEVTKCFPTLVNFIREKCTVIKPIELEKGFWRVFCGPMQPKWGAIVRQCHQSNVELTAPDKDAANPVIKLKGESLIVKKISNDIATLSNSISRSSFSLSRPGASKYFQERDQARVMLSGIEAEHKVCIELCEAYDAVADDPPAADTEDLDFTTVCVARTNELHQISIHVGNIAEFTKAEVIVNAANSELKHIGGVAKDISDGGGPVIQQESTKHVRAKGKLWDGDAWLTAKVGMLSCKALIHAVGPRWTGDQVKETYLLSQACTKSLRAAQKYQSIAFPAIGAGIFKFPIDICADTLIKAVVDFSKNNPAVHLHETHFVLFTDSDAQAFKTALTRHLPPQNIISESHPRKPPQPTTLVPRPHTIELPGTSPLGATTDTQSKKKHKKKPTGPSPSDIIKLHRGSLLDVTADVYVNTTNTKLDLSSGAVSQALLKAGGPDLQAECKKKAPISVGDVAVTGGGKLECLHIFHVVIPSYDGPGGQAEKVLKSSMHGCMKKCTKHGVTSIAFPSIGTGALRFPNDVVARIMVNEISNFLSSQKSTVLREVHLIIYMADTHKAFAKEVANLKSYDSSSKSEVATFIDSRSGHGQPVAASYPTATPSGSHATHSDPYTGQMYDVGVLKVQLVQGDITEDSSDALVNTTNKKMQLLGHGVAGALSRKAGPMLQQFCDTLTSQGIYLEEGKVVPTPSGSLKCTAVFHVCIESTDPKKLFKTIQACLQKAEDCKYKSIAFPALGTGVHGFSAEVAAKEMTKAIHQFETTSSLKFLACVRIVLFETDIYKSFIKAFNDSQPGWFQRARDYLGSFWSSSSDDTMASTPEGKMDKQLQLTIFGETDRSVQEAEKMLEKIIEEQFIEDEIDDPNVGNLPQSEVQMLETIAEKLEVQLQFFTSPLNIIRLKGPSAEVLQMKYKIQQALSSCVKQIGKRKEAEQLQKLIQWKRLNPIPQTYDPETNFEIEQSFTGGQRQYVHQAFTIDFDKMEGEDRSTNDTFKVERIDLEKQLQEGEKPDTWDPMPVDKATNTELQVHVVDVQTGSTEHNDVLKVFHKTMPQGTAYKSIVKIQRIQNPTLYAQYIAKKKAMDKHMPGRQNELQLFHGTTGDNCSKINMTSFNRSFAGQNATVYGQGCYFARDASYSARGTYSRPDSDGNKYIYLVRVLTGEYTVGNSSMKVPPAKDPNKDPNILFDSTVDNTTDPQIFVVFFDWQAYPEYLIVFN